MKVYKHPTHSNVTVVELPKKEIKKLDFAICKQPKETLKAFYDRQETKPDLIINGGIFNLSDGKTYYNYRDEGEDVSGWHWYTAGMGVVDGELKYGHIGSEKWTDFVTAYPPLIENGKALAITYATENSKNKRRSILAYDNENIYLYALAMLAKIRALPDNIGAGYKNAYIRKIGKYYKIQIGAFSKWAGANIVLADLKAMGFDAFITN